MTDALHTPRAIQALMARHGIAPRKTAGQNFLHDANVVRRIIAAAQIGPDDDVLEIGPGLGSLTLGLAAQSRSVVAIEIDAGLVRALTEILAGKANVTVVHADALATDFGAYGTNLRLVANLPYNTATPLVFHALESPAVQDVFVMVQREVAMRWKAVPNDPLYSAVSVKLALYATVEIAFAVPRSVFIPAPNVDSVMVSLRRRADAPPASALAGLCSLIDLAFAQRRKTLGNTLASLAPREVLTACADRAEVALSQRAEALPVAAFQRLMDEFVRAGVTVTTGARYGSSSG